jgi:hypothetical protein
MTPTGGEESKKGNTQLLYSFRISPSPPPPQGGGALQILIFAMQVPPPVKPISSGYYPIFGDPFNLINF